VCVCLGICIDRCVSEDFFIASLTRLFSEIICKNYTRDTKIINYIVYSEMYRYTVWQYYYDDRVCLCVFSVFFYFYVFLLP